MRIERRYTKEGQSPYADIAFRLTTSEIRNPDGSVVFHAENVEVPEQWSQVASDVLAQNYFRKADARAFFDEHRYMLAMQMVAPNSPQWFNTGLHWAYGINGSSQGHFYVDHKTGQLTQSATAY